MGRDDKEVKEKDIKGGEKHPYAGKAIVRREGKRLSPFPCPPRLVDWPGATSCVSINLGLLS